MRTCNLFFFILLILTCNTLRSQGIEHSAIKKKAAEAKKYCVANKLNTKFCILIDMSQHSGKKRAFLYDLEGDSVISTGMCAHGCGTQPWGATATKDKPVFSNTPDSHCSSLGKFKVGTRGYSSWGIHVNYLLHGLESTNSNALKRQIVLHSWDDVPEDDVFPAGTPEGWGCPAVSNSFMKTLDSKLKNASPSVLLWMYN